MRRNALTLDEDSRDHSTKTFSHWQLRYAKAAWGRVTDWLCDLNGSSGSLPCREQDAVGDLAVPNPWKRGEDPYGVPLAPRHFGQAIPPVAQCDGLL